MFNKVNPLLAEHLLLTKAFYQYDTARLLIRYGNLQQAKERLNQLEEIINHDDDLGDLQVKQVAGHQVITTVQKKNDCYTIYLDQFLKLDLTGAAYNEFFDTLNRCDRDIKAAEASHDMTKIFSYQQELETYLKQFTSKKEASL